MNRRPNNYPYWNTEVDYFYLFDTVINNIKIIRSHYQISEINNNHLHIDDDDVPIYIELITNLIKNEISD